ncbi:hypothetical protein TRFO_03715 [Tritrichomonas foetus]|uniref:Condensation domain-containing protein n=1 Tax=Tritrichomonas foetus TaxID=1144522 RepID=A0A1J4KQZ8_9EUKA|nr:hypothetical protein TRFO_03715 [Tritrichomonas foetus]|eukprot:OHT12094.1 hypothetical protein TRFO_03715 [Tritrichomonas foetus]
MLSKAIPASYQFELSGKKMVQLAFEVESKSFIDKIVNHFSSNVLGLHLRLKPGFLVYKPNSAIIHHLPDNLTSLESASDFLAKNIDNENSLGNIGYNDHQVVLNVSHSLADGGYFKFLTKSLFSDDFGKKKLNASFPKEVREIFADEINSSSIENIGYWYHNPKVNRIFSGSQNRIPSKYAKYFTVRMNSDSLKFVQRDNKNNSLHGVTESLWLSLFLASIVHTQKQKNNFSLPEFVSMPTCTDFRNKIKGKVDYSICNCYSHVTPFARVEANKTLKEIGSEMKKDMKMRLNRNDDLAFMKFLDSDECAKANKKPKIPGVNIELTYVGPLEIKKPVVDAWCSLVMEGKPIENILSLMGFSVFDKERSLNDMVVRLRYASSMLTDKEVSDIIKSLEFCMKNIVMEMTVKDAVEEINKFQLSQ